MRQTPDIAVNMEKIRDAAKLIADRFHPERIILFGSFATGTSGPDSDADILVVMDHGGKRREMAMKIRESISTINMPKDVFVNTPGELEKYRDIPGTISSIACRTGVTLYEAHHGTL